MKIPKEVKAITGICDKGGYGRYSLDCVSLEHTDKHSVAVATNGRCLIATGWKDETPSEVRTALVQKDALKTGKILSSSSVKSDTTGETQNTSILETETGPAEHVTVGTFPKWKEMYAYFAQTNKRKATVVLNASVAASFFSTLAKLHGKDAEVEMIITEDKNPLQVFAQGKALKSIALLMPCNVSSDFSKEKTEFNPNTLEIRRVLVENETA